MVIYIHGFSESGEGESHGFDGIEKKVEHVIYNSRD